MLPAHRRNLLWMMFNDAENRARAVLSQFRAAAGQRPDDPRFRPVEHPDMLMVLQVPRSMGDLQRVTSLLDAQPR